MKVSIHPPHEQPPPPSGINSIPEDGIVLSQQLGLNLGQLVTDSSPLTTLISVLIYLDKLMRLLHQHNYDNPRVYPCFL